MRLHAGDDPLVRLKMLSADQREPLSVGPAGAMLFIEESMCDLVAGHVEPEHVPNGYSRCADSLRVFIWCCNMCLKCNQSAACARPCNTSGALSAGSHVVCSTDDHQCLDTKLRCKLLGVMQHGLTLQCLMSSALGSSIPDSHPSVDRLVCSTCLSW